MKTAGFQASEEVYQEIKQAADRLGVNFSDFLRLAAQEKLAVVTQNPDHLAVVEQAKTDKKFHRLMGQLNEIKQKLDTLRAEMNDHPTDEKSTDVPHWIDFTNQISEWKNHSDRQMTNFADSLGGMVYDYGEREIRLIVECKKLLAESKAGEFQSVLSQLQADMKQLKSQNETMLDRLNSLTPASESVQAVNRIATGLSGLEAHCERVEGVLQDLKPDPNPPQIDSIKQTQNMLLSEVRELDRQVQAGLKLLNQLHTPLLTVRDQTLKIDGLSRSTEVGLLSKTVVTGFAELTKSIAERFEPALKNQPPTDLVPAITELKILREGLQNIEQMIAANQKPSPLANRSLGLMRASNYLMVGLIFIVLIFCGVLSVSPRPQPEITIVPAESAPQSGEMSESAGSKQPVSPPVPPPEVKPKGK